MGNLLEYSGTTTKIRAIRKRLLTEENYRELAASKNVTEALGYLKRLPAYQEIFAGVDEASLHRNQIERMLINAVYIDFQKIYRFAPVTQRRFLDMYFRRYEVAILKFCMRMLFDHRNIVLDLTIFQEFFEKHSDIDFKKVSTNQTLEEFVNNLKGSIYYKALSRLSSIKEPTLFDYEMALDLCYFSWFWKNKDKVLKKEARNIFTDAYGVKMDLLNIRWIHRSKKYFQMTSAEIYALLIPVQHHLTREEIKLLVEAPTMDEFDHLVRRTYYGRRYEDFCADTLDASYNRIRHQVQRSYASKEPYSIATQISYLFEKEHEIKKITMALECVRYGLSQGETLKYIGQ